MLRHRKTSQKSKGAAEKKNFFIWSVIFWGAGGRENVFLQFSFTDAIPVNIILFSGEKKILEKGFSNFLIFQKPYFRLFSRSARLGSVGARVVCRTDVLQDLQGSLIDVQRKTLKQNQSWNIQLFSVHANVQPCLLQLHAGCPFS